MRTPKMTTCKKCHRSYNTMSEVSVCPSCGTTNICYTHVMNDVASGLKFLTKITTVRIKSRTCSLSR